MTSPNRVGLGTFPLANVFSKITKDQAKDIVRDFIKQGGYYIDTAPMYGFGDVELLLGEVLNEFPRDSYYIVTKCMYIDVEGKTFQTIQKSGKYDDVIRECDRSLKRMGLDFIDLYLVHSPDPNTPFTETMNALRELKKQGKIKHIGVSNVDLDELKEFNKQGDVEFIQNRFSLINRSINQELSDYLLQHKIGLIPYQVIDRGQLTGKVNEGVNDLKDGDLRIGRSDWDPEKVNLIGDWVKNSIAPIAKKLGVTIGQLSVAWALHQPYLSFVIVGVTNPTYIPINLNANSIKLTKEQLTEIDEAYSKLEETIKSKFGISVREFRGLNEKYY
jgi:aryl-alcohol dehydrogenase-like predicted oxidoreductase